MRIKRFILQDLVNKQYVDKKYGITKKFEDAFFFSDRKECFSVGKVLGENLKTKFSIREVDIFVS